MINRNNCKSVLGDKDGKHFTVYTSVVRSLRC